MAACRGVNAKGGVMGGPVSEGEKKGNVGKVAIWGEKGRGSGRGMRPGSERRSGLHGLMRR